MNLLLPAALFHALWAIPLLVLLWILKKRREPLPVPSVMLWRQAMAEHLAHMPFRRFRRSLLFLAQLAVVLLLCVALARPFVAGSRLEGMRIVLVVDASASMGATDLPGGRMAAAKDRAIAWIRGLGSGSSMMLIRAGARPTVELSFSSDPSRLVAAVKALRRSDAPGSLARALELAAASLAGVRPGDRIVLVTDGSDPRGDVTRVGNVPVEVERVGRGGENLAIVDFRLRQSPMSAIDLQAYVEVANTGASARHADLRIEAEGSLSDLKRLRIEPGRRRSVVFRRLAMRPGLVTVHLEGGDDLAADDRAWAVVGEDRRLSVEVDEAPRPFWKAALAGCAMLRWSLRPGEPPGLAVHEGARPMGEGSAGHGACFSTAALPVWGVETGKLVRGSPVVDWDRSHPLLRFVNLQDLLLGPVRILHPPPGWVPLVHVAEGPVMAVGRSEAGHLRLRAGFEILAGELPLRAAFPMFCQNLVAACMAGRDEEAVHRAGRPIRLVLPEGGAPTLRSPSGRSMQLRAVRGTAVLPALEELGVWTVHGASPARRLAVNLLDEAESTLSIGRTGRAVPSDRGPVVARRALRREIWPWFVGGALILVLLEWSLWRRRAHGL